MHEIIVGNIGTVYSGYDKRQAQETYNEYVRQSDANIGRAAGETVIWFNQHLIHKEHYGSLRLAELDERNTRIE